MSSEDFKYHNANTATGAIPGCASIGHTAMQRNPVALLDDLFTYHHARPDQLPKYQAVRTAAKHFAEVMLDNTPPGADQSAAMRKIREAVMTANAAIALDGRT